MDWEVTRAMAGSGIVTRRENPGIARRLSWLCRKKELVAILPGVYTLPHLATDWEIRAAAACAYDPTAVVVADAAAALSYWPELRPEVIEVAGRRSTLRVPDFKFVTRTVPAALLLRRGPIRLTMPALTAIDQIPQRGGDGIDRALRSRVTTLEAMREALTLTPGRRGNEDRALLLLDSKDEPWSAAERLAHRLLRAAGIAGWRTNVRVACPNAVYYLDIAFDNSPVAIEIDGREYHGPEQFERDRRRGNDLLLAGRLVLHFTWRMLTNEPAGFVATTQSALAMAGRT